MAKFVISKNKVIKQFDMIKGISDIVAYSSKTNPIISGILEENTNCLFNIHNENEIKNINDKKRVMFMAQGWTKEKINKLIDIKIRLFVVDNLPDLEILEEFLKDNDVKISLLLRMKLKEHTLRTERHFVFGLNSETVNEKIPHLKKEFGDKLAGLGIHFHRKTQNISEWNIRHELENVIDNKVLDIIDFIDIGGGFPSEYANTNISLISGIFNKIRELKRWINQHNIKLITEPGRFIAAPSGRLILNILRIYENNIIVDASVYNSDLDALIVPVKLKVENELDQHKGRPYVIKGITPCSLDIFRYRVYLDDPKEGDSIVFLNAGAYNFTSDFCELDKIDTQIID